MHVPCTHVPFHFEQFQIPLVKCQLRFLATGRMQNFGLLMLKYALTRYKLNLNNVKTLSVITLLSRLTIGQFFDGK